MQRELVEKRLIFDTIVGSHAYGTNRPDSDEDTVGVTIPTAKYFLSFDKFEQMNYSETDRVVYDIRKALKLISDNNPNMMDLLFVPDRCITKMTKYWEMILEKRDWFISKKCKFTYSGYAIAQLERIKTHRAYLLDPPKAEPKREDYGLPSESVFPVTQIDGIVMVADDYFLPEDKEFVLQELRSIHSDQIVPLLKKKIIPEYRPIAMDFLKRGLKAQVLSIKAISDRFIRDEYKQMAVDELRYASAMKNWKRYLEWQKTRNRKRAHLEAKFGFDSKHAMHLVRLMRIGKEILSTGVVNVDRTHIDADELKAIGNGEWKYEKVESFARECDQELDALYKTSSLQKTPKREKIAELCLEVVELYLSENG